MDLYTNAVYAMRKSGGKISIVIEEVKVDQKLACSNPNLRIGSYVKLSVSDTGEGISPDAMPHIFEPFFTTKPEGEGTGMGLAVAYGIVTSHGGAITVSSKPGRGTTFDIYFPKFTS